MKLELLETSSFLEKNFHAVIDAHGLYNTEQFVLRLSPKNHGLIDEITDGNFDSNIDSNIDSDLIQAYSTYLHETIHWWQHTGSITGLVMSLCYPLQTHLNSVNLKNWSKIGKISKSVKTHSLKGELSGLLQNDNKQALGNTIINNTMDIDFYKRWILQPNKAEEIFNAPYFESQGHSFQFVYGSLMDYIKEIAKPLPNVMPDTRHWEKEFEKLLNRKANGYYYRSPILKKEIGVVELFEGQACFSQMQFIANSFNRVGKLEDFKKSGMLHGVYEKAFNTFIKLTHFEFPETVLDPVVGLFLLVCDLSINPVEGFPCDIENFEDFVHIADPGVRFDLLCAAVINLNLNPNDYLVEYTKQEYIQVASLLLDSSNLKAPWEGWIQLEKWIEGSSELKLIMEEHESFKFKSKDIVFRVLLSHFISFSKDKFEHPEFFCWPGYWKASGINTEIVQSLWLKHLSLFSDKECDDGIFIRKFSGKDDADLHKVLNEFFGNNLVYNLTRQWILNDGDFKYNFKWLSEDISEEEWKGWADSVFNKLYGVSISQIEAG
ncbi:MAG: hypothetical protein HRU40_09245 [Saprospiraceae bacterium]|nr:hypothetical protein [Saprospiraceae bacterium]